MTETRLVLGIDLGGSKILTAVVDGEGNMLSRDHSVTPAARGVEAVIAAVLASARSALSQAGVIAGELAGIGVGAPGLSSPERGVIFTSPNLPGWKDVPLKDIVQEALGVKVYLINDANAAALGEMMLGAARGARNFIYITLSTGIGGGIVIDGQVYSGSLGTAGEIGHMTIDAAGPRCNCGNTGCWETLASGTALAREARNRLKEGVSTSILDYARGDIGKVTAETVQRAAEQGDALAAELITRTSYYVGVGLANLINIFNPELIVIGGGLSNMGAVLLEPAYAVARERAYRVAFDGVRFARAELGRNSGVIGAAAFVFQQAEKKRK